MTHQEIQPSRAYGLLIYETFANMEMRRFGHCLDVVMNDIATCMLGGVVFTGGGELHLQFVQSTMCM